MASDRPRRELQRRIPTGRGDRGGSSCGGFIVNGGLWWPESALEAPTTMSVFGRERERDMHSTGGERERAGGEGERKEVTHVRGRKKNKNKEVNVHARSINYKSPVHS